MPYGWGAHSVVTPTTSEGCFEINSDIIRVLELKDFKAAAAIIGNDNFWKYLFLMCRALYAPMRVLRLADLKTPAMDKLYFYVLQADRMLCNI